MVNITSWNSEFPKNVKLAYLTSVILKKYPLEKKLIIDLSAFYLQFQFFCKINAEPINEHIKINFLCIYTLFSFVESWKTFLDDEDFGETALMDLLC